MTVSKKCAACGKEFYKRDRDSKSQWAGRMYCSISCNNRSREKTPLHLRFWAYVETLGAEKCWEWKGSKSRGYGILQFGNGISPYKAHRLSYEMFNGPIPDGMLVRHKCDNPSCVNPHHLETGTAKDNAMDASRRGRLNKKSLLNLNHKKVLGDSEVLEIKKIEFACKNGRGGITVREIANKYGVCEDVIRAVKYNRY